MQTTKDFYKLLGLSRGASQEDIRKAHRNLVRKYHPDANPQDPRAEERFKKIQQAYEVLSNEKKRREYDHGLRTTSSGEGFGGPRSRGSSSKSRTRAGGRTGGETTYTVDLSELLGKLANLSRERSGGQKEGNFQLRGEEVAHLAKLLGEEVARISELLGKDTARLSRLLGENMKISAKVGFEDDRSGTVSAADEDMGGKEPSTGSKPREKKVKGPRAQGREKKVKGPRARRRGRSS